MTTENNYMIPTTGTTLPLNIPGSALKAISAPAMIAAPRATSAATTIEKRTKRPKKDPNAPRHFTSAFQLFWKEKADYLNELHKTKPLSLMDRNLIVKKFYDELSPEERQKYRELANEDRARYLREMDAYKCTPEYTHHLQITGQLTPGLQSASGIKKRKKGASQSGPKVLTAFFLFCNEMRASVQPEPAAGESKLLAQTKALTQLWHALDEASKDKYRQVYLKQREEQVAYNALQKNENLVHPNVAMSQVQIPSSNEFDLLLHDVHDDEVEEAEEDECVDEQTEY